MLQAILNPIDIDYAMMGIFSWIIAANLRICRCYARSEGIAFASPNPLVGLPDEKRVFFVRLSILMSLVEIIKLCFER